MKISDYVFRDIKKIEPQKELVWNVFIEDWNGREMEVFNVFHHRSFLRDLVAAKKTLKADLKKMSEKEAIDNFKYRVWRDLSYYYWSKSEWEIVLTSWPPHLSKEQLDRLNEERAKAEAEGHDPVRYTTGLDIGEKVDVKTQIAINWEQFIQYVLDNLKLIKMPKD